MAEGLGFLEYGFTISTFSVGVILSLFCCGLLSVTSLCADKDARPDPFSSDVAGLFFAYGLWNEEGVEELAELDFFRVNLFRVADCTFCRLYGFSIFPGVLDALDRGFCCDWGC